MDIKLVLILSVLAIIANTEAAKEKRRDNQPTAAIGENCFNKRCPRGTSCRKVCFCN